MQQYQEISTACDALCSLMQKAKRVVPDHVEDTLSSTIDSVLTCLEALEAAWDIRSPE